MNVKNAVKKNAYAFKENKMDTKIIVHDIEDTGEDADFCYCAVVMLWGNMCWYNSGIVVRRTHPTEAFVTALKMAKEAGYWK